MLIVKVWNKNSYPYSEKFKDQPITIEANSYVEMDYDEAVLFMGTFRTPVKMKDGRQDPKSYKWLEIDKDDQKAVRDARASAAGDAAEKTFVCHVCQKEFRTKNGLLKHTRDKHIGQLVDKDARDELLDNEDLE